MQFAFRAKGGLQRTYAVTDRRLARIIRRCQELPGQELFHYIEDGVPQPIDSRDVNDYLRAATGGPATAKDFRTWGASVAVLDALSAAPLPTSAAARTRELSAAITLASRRLANTPAVCRRSYVHPSVVHAYPDVVACLPERNIKRVAAAHGGLHVGETRLLALLDLVEGPGVGGAGLQVAQ